jgi:hypothetical protein
LAAEWEDIGGGFNPDNLANASPRKNSVPPLIVEQNLQPGLQTMLKMRIYILTSVKMMMVRQMRSLAMNQTRGVGMERPLQNKNWRQMMQIFCNGSIKFHLCNLTILFVGYQDRLMG